MGRLVYLLPFLAGSVASAQGAAQSVPVPGQDGLNSAMFWFGVTVVAMVIALYAVHRSVYRKK